jgi:DNA-binding transcriptional regulator YhcF (GntR family)
MADAADLAELLFPRNANQQHAFLVIWTALKWSHDLVPNLATVAQNHGVSRRTLERVRAKLCRLGIIEHVSRYSARLGYRDGWILSSRFERSLALLAERVAALKTPGIGSREKDEFAVQLAAARRSARQNRDPANQSQQSGGGEVP